MKKLFLLGCLVAFFSMVVFASAGIDATVVSGTVYYEGDINNAVSGVIVQVVCNDSNVLNTTSGVDGEYSVSFTSNKCGCGDDVFVSAYEGVSMIGANEGSISICGISPAPSITLDVGVVNVPVVPEFGFVVGILTILGAVGIFFVVRKD